MTRYSITIGPATDPHHIVVEDWRDATREAVRLTSRGGDASIREWDGFRRRPMGAELANATNGILLEHPTA